ncbi:MAG: hypothetical protein Q9191_000708 [Dirinaria sp. TL-2023a]
MAIGWSVLWHLADLAKLIERGMGVHQLDDSCDQDARYKILATTELVTRKEWLDYVESLSISERLAHHRIWDWIFPFVFRNPVAYPAAWADVQEKPNVYLFNLALHWAYMYRGPDLFKEAWSSREGNHSCARWLSAQWNAKPAELQKLCVQTSTDVFTAFHGRNNGRRSWDDYDDQSDYYHAISENEEDPQLMIGSFRDIQLHILPSEIDMSRVAPLVKHPDDILGSPGSSSSSNF